MTPLNDTRSNQMRYPIAETIKVLQNQTWEEINAVKSFTKRPYVDVTINQTQVKFLYDTGADVSCLNEKLFKKLQLPLMSVVKKDCRSAGGQVLNIIGQTDLSIYFDGKTFSHTFLIIKNLNEEGIFGIDLISKHQLNYSPTTREFSWNEGQYWKEGVIRSVHSITLSPLSVTPVKISVVTDKGWKVSEGQPVGVCVYNPNRPLLTSMPGLIMTDHNSSGTMMVQNCSPVEMRIPRGEVIGLAENYEDVSAVQIDGDKINSIQKPFEKSLHMDREKYQFLKENMKFQNIPEKYKREYEKVIMTNHEVFSKDKNELGWSNLVEHEISLKDEAPVYVKQFKIPEMHMNEVQKHLQEWLKLGIIEPCRSKYNSPLFLVAKKDGGLRIVQDFRALNENTHVDKYSMHDVNECVAEIGRAGSTIFTTLDLTSGFWQMALHPRSRPFTAFTIPGRGQFQWKVAPMGLLGSPASFQRLVETALRGINNVIVYIDDLLIHSHSHEEHIKTLEKVFARLTQHGLKVNFKKCEFASQEVSYLGFRLTPEGIKPGTDKLKAVSQAKPPTSLKEIRQFMGLCNFFRNHVKNFSLISGPLTALTKKDSGWKKGELPEEAYKAFKELQTILCSEPVVDYPRRDRLYSLITDAACGDDKNPGGLGAILTQTDEEGQFRVIGYASRKLVKHEKNYTPFLLEMQAAIWGMEHFDTYLKGRQFTLYTDHKPLEKLGKVHTKTLNRLQEAMNTYNFKIVYKKGDEMPADFLSRNTVANISWQNEDILHGQQNDELIKNIVEFLQYGTIPGDKMKEGLVRKFSENCFVEDGLLWKRICDNKLNRVVLFAPHSMKNLILQHAHGSQFTGHEGIFKTKQRILSNYYWPNIDKDVIEMINACHKCQMMKNRKYPIQALLKPLPQCSEINQRVHADLFGPLKTSGNHKKYILCMTDAFSKYVELVPLPDKEAVTVAQGIFYRWLCRFGAPLILTTDGGKEFTAKVCKELYKVMNMEHFTTSPYHPQCNSQAEIVNKTIAKYLSTFVDDSTLDWELYLAPLMFAYNTSIHRATKFSPFKLTYGVDPRLPGFVTPDLNRKFYGETPIDDLQNTMKFTRQLAFQNNEDNRQHYKEYFDSKVRQNSYYVGQKVLLNEFHFLHKNKKLAPKYSGPHLVSKLVHDTNVELTMQNGRKVIVHINRLKPYISRQVDDDVTTPHPIDLHNNDDDVTPILPVDAPTLHPSTLPPRRPRGRPKKLISPTLFEEREGCPNDKKSFNTDKNSLGQNKTFFAHQNNQNIDDQMQISEDGSNKNNSNEAKTDEFAKTGRITRSQAQKLNQEGQTIEFHKLDDIKSLKNGFNSSVFYQSSKQKQGKKKTKNGSSTNRFLQEANFKKTGDIWGPKHTIIEYEAIEDDDDSGSSSDSSYHSEQASEDESDAGGDPEGSSESGEDSTVDEGSDGPFYEFDDDPFEGMAEGPRVSDHEEDHQQSGGSRNSSPGLQEEDKPPPVPPKLRSTPMGPIKSEPNSEIDFQTSKQHFALPRSKKEDKIHPNFYVRNKDHNSSRPDSKLDKILPTNDDSSIKDEHAGVEVLPYQAYDDRPVGGTRGATSYFKSMGSKPDLSPGPSNSRTQKCDVTAPASQRPTRSNTTAPPIGALPIKPVEYKQKSSSSKKPS